MNIKDEIEKKLKTYVGLKFDPISLDDIFNGAFTEGALFALKLAKEKGWLQHSKCEHRWVKEFRKPNTECTCGLDDLLKLLNGDK